MLANLLPLQAGGRFCPGLLLAVGEVSKEGDHPVQEAQLEEGCGWVSHSIYLSPSSILSQEL